VVLSFGLMAEAGALCNAFFLSSFFVFLFLLVVGDSGLNGGDFFAYKLGF